MLWPKAPWDRSQKPIFSRNTAALVENVFQTDFIISYPHIQTVSNLYVLLIYHILSFIFLVLKITISLPGVFYNEHFYDEYVSWFALPFFEPRYQWRYVTKNCMFRCNRSFSETGELSCSCISEAAVRTPLFNISIQTDERASAPELFQSSMETYACQKAACHFVSRLPPSCVCMEPWWQEDHEARPKEACGPALHCPPHRHLTSPQVTELPHASASRPTTRRWHPSSSHLLWKVLTGRMKGVMGRSQMWERPRTSPPIAPHVPCSKPTGLRCFYLGFCNS